MSLVAENIMNIPNYAPYCGAMCKEMPRTTFNGEQFVCPSCGWVSKMTLDFVEKYKKKWGIK